MKKRITAIMTAVVMIFTFAGTTVTAKAATTPFMTVVWDGPVKEKVGNYYIWGKECQTDDAYKINYELRCAKNSNEKGILITTVSEGRQITSVISNGQIIYYGVFDKNAGEMTIYKASVTGNMNKKFRTIKDVQTACGPITVFDGRLYYDRDTVDITGNVSWNVYSVNLNNKDCRLEKSGFKGQSGYGRYMTCDNESKYVKTQLYNAKTRESTLLISSITSRVYNGSIYYGDWHSMGSFVYKTDLSGKNLVTLATVGGEDEEYQVIYLGKKVAYFKSYLFGYAKKLTYATKNVVPVSIDENTADEGEESTETEPIAPDDGQYEYIMTVDPIPDVLWQGKDVYPKVNVRVNGKLLKKSQYIANYVNNGGVGYG